MKRLMSVLLLACSVAVPVAMADEHDAKTYYDKKHHDSHQWNDNEESSYSRFRTERNIKQHDFAHAKKSEQQEYWNWRHEHPDEKR